MDPEQAVRDLNQLCADAPDGSEDASNLAEDIYAWIERGGFTPREPLTREACHLFPYLFTLQERARMARETRS